jgi:hypothetical protein
LEQPWVYKLQKRRKPQLLLRKLNLLRFIQRERNRTPHECTEYLEFNFPVLSIFMNDLTLKEKLLGLLLYFVDSKKFFKPIMR